MPTATYRRLAGALIAAAMLFGLTGCGDEASLEHLDSADQQKRLKALDALTDEESDEAIEAVERVTRHEDRRTAQAAVRVYTRMNRRRASRALRTLGRIADEDQRPSVRTEAVTQMAYLNPTDESGAPVAEKLRTVAESDEDPNVRAAAATGLGRLGDRSAETIETLLRIAETAETNKERARAVAAIEHLIDLDFGFEPTDPPAKQRATIQRIRGLALQAAAALEQEKRMER